MLTEVEVGNEKKETPSDPSRFCKFARTPSNLPVLGSASLNEDFSSQGVKDCWEAAALT